MINNTTTILILVIILILVSVAAATRTKIYLINGEEGKFASSPPANAGICKTMVEPQGYKCHEHTVTTKDGYILSLQRMPNAQSGHPTQNPPVFLQHGLLMDGRTWLINSPNESLAFILADNGYDVWIGNTRGTKYSRKHEKLTPRDAAYWDWSWDELMAYDFTAFIKFVYHETGKKLHYVGHSMGTLLALAAFSKSDHRLLKKIRSAALLTPIAHLGHMKSPIARTACQLFLAEDIYWLGLHEFSPSGKPAADLLDYYCNQPGNDCSDLMTSFTGRNCCLNSSATGAFLHHEAQSTATKNMIHMAQMSRTGAVATYDYGAAGNMYHYGQITPPVHNMANIPHDLPLFLSYGGNDLLSDVEDVKLLLDNLKDHDTKKLAVQYIENYAHMDFVFGINANQLVYNPLMAFFSLN